MIEIAYCCDQCGREAKILSPDGIEFGAWACDSRSVIEEDPTVCQGMMREVEDA